MITLANRKTQAPSLQYCAFFSFLAHDTLSTSSIVKSVDTDPTRQNSLYANQTILHAETKQITKLSPLVQTSAPRLKTQKTIPLPNFFL